MTTENAVPMARLARGGRRSSGPRKAGPGKAAPWGGNTPASADVARQRIAELAFEILAERGVRRTFMSEVARAAGISRPTLYKYFPTKESLVFGALSLEVEPWLRRLHRRMHGFEKPQERLVEGTLYAIQKLPKTRVLKFVADPEYLHLLRVGDPQLQQTLSFTVESLQPVLELSPHLRERQLEVAELCYRTITSFLQIQVGRQRSAAEMRDLLHRTLVPGLGFPPSP